MEKTHFESTEDILQFAIDREIDAQNFYNEWSVKVKNPAIGEMLKGLALQEKGHEEHLKRVKKSGELKPSEKHIVDLKIADYLVDVKPTEDMDYQQALTIAMEREQSSVNLYKTLAKLAPNEKIQDLFLNLVEEEVQHKARLEDEYDENILREN
ncbi:MAG: ferritin family protein [Candidatus Cloacimonetes bacterium]|nr:ferritin family protein [Candidatus Cloacimonadota bacterium]